MAERDAPGRPPPDRAAALPAPPAPRPHVNRSPEARRQRALLWAEGLQDAIEARGPLRRMLAVLRRVIIGVWDDGFIHAGNLAYMTIAALFPFFIVVGAVFSAVGDDADSARSVDAFLGALPPIVRHVVNPVARSAMSARHGWLLWIGGVVGLWTVTSLIETVRDILRRAYGVSPGDDPKAPGFWRHRLGASGVIMLAVVLLMVSLYLQVAINAIELLVTDRLHRLAIPLASLLFTRALPAGVLFGSIYLLFVWLTPGRYRFGYPHWPGALFVTLWWGMVSAALPGLLRYVFKYDLTYGSLAGVMIALFFFWLVGLGVVTGAELNAALAVTPEERDMLGEPPRQPKRKGAGLRADET